MKYRLGIIGASYLQLPLVLKAKEMGMETICFAWKEGAAAESIADRFYPVSVLEKDTILDICKKERIQAITTIASDIAVPTVAHVAAHMNLVGNTTASAHISTNKYAMREALRRGGARCPDYIRICHLKDVERQAAVLRFPVIVKPCDRSGSAGVTKVPSLDELRNATDLALSCSLGHKAIIEEFIDGTEVSVESISWRGQHHILAITDKVTSGQPHFVELAHHQPSQHPAGVRAEIERQTRIGLQALNIEYGATHSEFLITEVQSVFVTEIGARMGGDFIGSDLVRMSTGYDFLRGVIEVAFGNFSKPVLSEKKHSGIWFYSRHTPQVLNYIENRNHHPEVVQAEVYSRELPELTKSADRSGYFIYQSDRRIVCSVS